MHVYNNAHTTVYSNQSLIKCQLSSKPEIMGFYYS